MVDYPNDWEDVKIFDLMSPYGGLSGKKSADFKDGNKKYISYLNVFNNLYINFVHEKVNIKSDERQNVVKKGDIIFTQSSETQEEVGMASTYIGDEEVYLNSFCFGSRKKTEFNSIFMVFLLRSNDIREKISKEGQGSTRYNLSPKRLMSIQLRLPPLHEQKAIAETLMTFDRHLETLERLIQKKKMVRDGAVEDLMTGKTRLDDFDYEWETVNFEDVIIPKARIGWQGLKKDEYLSSGYSYLISGTDFYNGTITFDNISYVSKDRYDLDKNIQVTSGDVLVTKDGTIGKVAIVPKIDKKATLNSGVFVFRTNELLFGNFLYWTLRSNIFENFIDKLSAGSTIMHLYQKDLKKLYFYIPKDIQEQKAIADILTSMDEELENLEKEKAKVEKIKAGAMEDLLTGRIRLI